MMALRTVLNTGFLPTIFEIYFLDTPTMNTLGWLLSHARSKAGRCQERQITIHRSAGFDRLSAINKSVAWTPHFSSNETMMSDRKRLRAYIRPSVAA
jgi:hypothetical protein